MKTYTVYITETLQTAIDVEAESWEDAEEEAERMYYNQEIVLDYNDYINVDFQVDYSQKDN